MTRYLAPNSQISVTWIHRSGAERLSLACAVSAADGEADVGVLGSQPGVSPHSPEGEEDPGQDAGVPRHQTVTETETELALKDTTAAAAAKSAWPIGEREQRD